MSPMQELNETAEQKRLDEAREQKIPWKKWGPYLSDRQWGTVREDYGQWRCLGFLPAGTTRVHAPTAGARTACRYQRR